MKNDDRWARAVIAAVHLHGLAGDAARDKMGEASLIAGDIIDALPEAFRRAKPQAAVKSFTIGSAAQRLDGRGRPSPHSAGHSHG
jgi:hypothetical protein